MNAEIAEWMSRHPEVKSFVILDDGGDMHPVKSHLVQTTWADGLQEEHVLRVLACFARQER